MCGNRAPVSTGAMEEGRGLASMWEPDRQGRPPQSCLAETQLRGFSAAHKAPPGVVPLPEREGAPAIFPLPGLSPSCEVLVPTAGFNAVLHLVHPTGMCIPNRLRQSHAGAASVWSGVCRVWLRWPKLVVVLKRSPSADAAK